MTCRDVIDRLSPFLDEELGPVASGEIQQHLNTCPECAAAFSRLRELSSTLKDGLEYHPATDLLRTRVLRDVRAAGRGEAAPLRPAPQPMRLFGAAAAVAVAFGGLWLFTMLPRTGTNDRLAREAVSGHIRSLMANHLTDVATTDQHTVKPWFSDKLDFSPPVTDFAGAGYSLAGGRLDYLDGHPVAALVYHHGRHTINVFVWPEVGGEGTRTLETERGFHVISVRHAGMAYWTVSDLNPEELATFARMLATSPAKP